MPSLFSPALLIVVLSLSNLVLLYLVMQVVLKLGWNELASSFPAKTPQSGATRRRFQTISIAGASFGPCVQIVVDGRWLHLQPGFILKLCGARGISVPWSDVSPGPRRRVMGAEHIELAIGDAVVTGPAWCMEPAGPLGRQA